MVTEHVPPFNYVKDGELRGVSSEVVKAALDRAGIEYRIEVKTWKEAYKQARKERNVLLYSVVRTNLRENHFRWLGEIAAIAPCFFRLPGTGHRINTLADAKNFHIGAHQGGYAEQLLRRHGLKRNRNLFPAEDPQELWGAIHEGKVDLVIAAGSSVEYRKAEGSLPFKLQPEKVFCVEETPLYMALSPSSDPYLGDQIVRALEAIKADGSFADIHRRTQSAK